MRWCQRNPAWSVAGFGICALLVIAVASAAVALWYRDLESTGRFWRLLAEAKVDRQNLSVSAVSRAVETLDAATAQLTVLPDRSEARAAGRRLLRDEWAAVAPLVEVRRLRTFRGLDLDDDRFTLLGFDPQFARYLVFDDPTVVVRRLDDHTELARLRSDPPYVGVGAVFASPSGRWVAFSTHPPHRWSVWDLELPRRPVFEAVRWQVHRADFDPQEEYLAVARKRPFTLELIRLRQPHTAMTLGLEGPVTAVAFHPLERWLAVAAGQEVRVLELPGEREIWSRSYPSATKAVAWHPEGILLAAVFDDGSLRVLDGETFEAVTSLSQAGAAFRGATFDQSGGRLLTWRRDATFQLWNAYSLNPLATIVGATAHWQPYFDPEDRLVAFPSAGGARQRQPFVLRELRPLDRSRRHLYVGLGAQHFSAGPAARLLVAAKDRSIKIWELDPGRREADIEMENRVREVRLSPDGRRLVARASREALHLGAFGSGSWR